MIKKILQKKQDTDESGLSLIEILVVMVFISLVILLSAQMLLGTSNSNTASQSVTEYVSHNREISDEFSSMMRNASAYRIRTGSSGRDNMLMVETGDGKCQTWIWTNMNIVSIFRDGDVRFLNNSSNPDAIANNWYRQGRSTYVGMRTPPEKVYENIGASERRMFRNINSSSSGEHVISMMLADVNTGNSSAYNISASPRTVLSETSDCWN